MRRRDFISLLGGAPLVWPLTARAQSTPTPVIGTLHSQTRESEASRLGPIEPAGFSKARSRPRCRC